MAMFTKIQFAESLHQIAEQAGPGRPTATPEFERWVVEQIDVLKRDRRALEGGRGYGGNCSARGSHSTDADALRCFMRDQYRARLIGEGKTPVEAARLVIDYAAGPDFERHLQSNKVSLSEVRNRR